jgi:CRP/FNR family transcriptional regulator, cyclic AMP receptor protein
MSTTVPPATLAKLPLLATLTDQEREALAPRLARKQVKRNSIVLKYGSSGASMFFVLEGVVRITRTDGSGKTLILLELGQGGFFGEVGLLTGRVRTADVWAVTDCTLLELDREALVAHAGRHSGLPLALATALAEKLSFTNAKVVDLAFLDVAERLYKLLWELSVPSEGEQYRIVRDRPSHQEMASSLGTSREVVSRALRSLGAAGQLEMDGQTVWLPLNQKVPFP